jgi:hypothetical protein
MKRALHEIPTHELSALVEQGMPVADYVAEMECRQKREPDCVFDVWSDNLIVAAGSATPQALLRVKANLKQRNSNHWITHRIRVFLKVKA